MLHLVFHQLLHLHELLRNHLEDQLIVNLQQHLTTEAPGSESIVDSDHRNLYEIGRGSLNRRIRSHPFTKCTNIEVSFAELGDISPPAEYRLHISILAGKRHH